MVAFVALIVFGPERLPEIARKVGQTLNDLRRMTDDMRGEFREGFDLGAVEDEPEEAGPASDHPVAKVIRDDAAAEPGPTTTTPDGSESPIARRIPPDDSAAS